MRFLPSPNKRSAFYSFRSNGSSLYIPVLLAVATGMRRGEILGLRWSDVELDAATLSVRQALQQVGGTRAGLSTKTPKTSKSRRVIDLPEQLVKELRRHKGSQAQQRLLIGDRWIAHDLVCCDEYGQPLRPNGVTQRFSEAAKRLGLTVTFHGLRHTHASQLLQRNVHPKVVSERLGHSTVGITLDLYSHVAPSLGREAAGKIDGLLRLSDA